MIALLALVLVSSPLERKPELKRCVTSCSRSAAFDGVTECLFEELPTCGRYPECVDAPAMICKPLRVTLGIID